MNRKEYKEMVAWRETKKHYYNEPYIRYKCHNCGNEIVTHVGFRGWIVPYITPCIKCKRPMVASHRSKRAPRGEEIMEWYYPTYHRWLKLGEPFKAMTEVGYLILEPYENRSKKIIPGKR